MRALQWALMAMVASLIVLLPCSPAIAGCDANGDLLEADVNCYYSGDEVRTIFNSGASYRWSIDQSCKTESPDGVCFNPIECVTDAGVSGTLYNVFRTPLPSGTRELFGVACLTSEEAGSLGAITPAMVFAAMKRLTWPRSELVVQPPGGETLVNLETNFYTTNTAASTQVIRLLGQRVEIEATPTSYVWHWAGSGEDGGSIETDGPGAAYPDLEVTHTYRSGDVTVHPWVDTVYAGRYRVNGDGWTAIPDTLTVTGNPVELHVLEARPVLVG